MNSNGQNNFDSRDSSCPACHYHSDQFRETGKCLCGYNMQYGKVVHAAPDIFEKPTGKDEGIYDMLHKTLMKTKLKKVRTQIHTMALIYEFFNKNPKFDYTVSDIMKGIGAINRYSVELALYRLQQCDYVKHIREISNKASFQLTTWETQHSKQEAQQTPLS